MSTETTGTVDRSLTDRFRAALRANRRTAKHTTENADFLLMFRRMIRALEDRAIDDPAILAEIAGVLVDGGSGQRVGGLLQRLEEVVDVAIATNADRYARDPFTGASMAECARILGMSVPGASKRRAKGNLMILARIEAAGAAILEGHRSAEALRERDSVQALQTHAEDALGAERVVQLAAYRGRHAA